MKWLFSFLVSCFSLLLFASDQPTNQNPILHGVETICESDRQLKKFQTIQIIYYKYLGQIKTLKIGQDLARQDLPGIFQKYNGKIISDKKEAFIGFTKQEIEALKNIK